MVCGTSFYENEILNILTNQQIRNVLDEETPGGDLEEAILGLLCTEFNLVKSEGTGIRVWGHFEEGQMLPEHIYVTYTNNMIYDTMPNAPVRRKVNNSGRNAPSYGDDADGNDVLLSPDVIYSVEVAALAVGTQAVINTPDTQWANG